MKNISRFFDNHTDKLLLIAFFAVVFSPSVAGALARGVAVLLASFWQADIGTINAAIAFHY